MHGCRRHPLGFLIILVAFQHDKPFTPGSKYCLYHPPLAFSARYVSPTPISHFYLAVKSFPAQLHYTNPSSRSQHTILEGEESLSSGGLFCDVRVSLFIFFSLAGCKSYRLHLHTAHVLEESAFVSQRPRSFCLFLPRPFPFHIGFCSMS